MRSRRSRGRTTGRRDRGSAGCPPRRAILWVFAGLSRCRQGGSWRITLPRACAPAHPDDPRTEADPLRRNARRASRFRDVAPESRFSPPSSGRYWPDHPFGSLSPWSPQTVPLTVTASAPATALMRVPPDPRVATRRPHVDTVEHHASRPTATITRMGLSARDIPGGGPRGTRSRCGDGPRSRAPCRGTHACQPAVRPGGSGADPSAG